MKTTITTIFLGYVIYGLANISQAQDNDISSDLNVYRITTTEDGETAEEVKQIIPGDTLEYRLTYTNNLPSAISNLQPVLPVPSETTYLGNTAQPHVNAASLTGSGDTYQSLPIQRKYTLPSGLIVEREVPAKEYRRLQWTVSSLKSQQSVMLTARVRVRKNNR